MGVGETFDPRQALQHARNTTNSLAPSDWHDVITAFTGGAFTDAQMSAWLMARVLHGITETEAVALTDAMLHSGSVTAHPDATKPVVDKHSTGGVADTTTLIVAPLAASVGLQVAKLSGKSLGHTGGTLDKLAAIPGMSTEMDMHTFETQVHRLGVAIAAATHELAPADRLLYTLRDHVELVDDIALIAASIMSKKLATGAHHLLLDVKLGQASFLANDTRTRELAALMRAIGIAHGRQVTVVLSDMNQPLGPAIGNALEVNAAIAVLRGEAYGRLGELSVTLCAELLQQTGVAQDDAYDRVTHALQSGAALERFASLVAAQGGDAHVTDRPRETLGIRPPEAVWRPSTPGFVTKIDTRRLGVLARELALDAYDLAAGLEGEVTLGMAAEDLSVAIHTTDAAKAEQAKAVLAEAVQCGPTSPLPQPLVVDIIR